MRINYTHSEDVHNTAAATEVLPFVFNMIHPVSVADIGCGTGSWLKVAKTLGARQVLGVDGIRVDQAMLCIEPGEFLQHNLALPLITDNKFDLAICLEVAEHLAEKDADNIVDILAGLSDVILFSAGIPGQGGQFHENEQWPAYWQQKFEDRGCYPIDNLRPVFWDNARVDWWYRQNMLLYVKKNAVDRLNLTAAAKLPAYIHPELLKLKQQMLQEKQQHIDYLEDIVRREVDKPLFIPSLKKLIKSVIR